MLINYTLLICLGALAGLLVLIPMIFLFRKIKKNNGATLGFVIGLFLGLAVFAFVIVYGNSKVYVVNGPDNCTAYAAYGVSEYKMSGKKVKIDSKAQSVLVINDSKLNLVLEKVVYGGFSTPYNAQIFAGDTFASKEVYSIDYFFSDAPPRSLSSEKQQEEKYWLRAQGN